jgi:F420-0:gamma-glutamyl ligase-like protein
MGFDHLNRFISEDKVDPKIYRRGRPLKLKAIKVKTRYWRPGTDWIREVVDALEGVVRDGDVVTVSEKAISTARGLMVDESKVRPGRVARFLASFWMRRIWGGPLAKLTRLREHTTGRLRSYPLSEGAAHKQVALNNVGILQSLRHYSEGGIDASNLPYSYISLPLEDPGIASDKLRGAIAERGSSVTTMIVDGDTTYSWRNIHLSPRKVNVRGLIHLGGFLTFVVGRMFGFKSRSTPIACSGGNLNPDWALTLANVAHRVRGHGAGRTVWEMVENLGVELTGVTWEMLDLLDHYPVLILREA